jgi:hypothetical protein
VNAVFEELFAKVDQQAEPIIGKSQIRQKRLFKDRRNSLDGL